MNKLTSEVSIQFSSQTYEVEETLQMYLFMSEKQRNRQHGEKQMLITLSGFIVQEKKELCPEIKTAKPFKNHRTLFRVFIKAGGVSENDIGTSSKPCSNINRCN